MNKKLCLQGPHILVGKVWVIPLRSGKSAKYYGVEQVGKNLRVEWHSLF